MNLFKTTLLIETDDSDPTDWIIRTLETHIEDIENTKIKTITTVNMDPEIWG